MDVKARMSGEIVSINVKAGDQVKARDILLVMEAMKMEQPIPAPKAGTVKNVRISIGEKIKSGAVLVELE